MGIGIRVIRVQTTPEWEVFAKKIGETVTVTDATRPDETILLITGKLMSAKVCGIDDAELEFEVRCDSVAEV